MLISGFGHDRSDKTVKFITHFADLALRQLARANYPFTCAYFTKTGCPCHVRVNAGDFW